MKYKKLWNKEIELLSADALHGLHEKAFLKQYRYLLSSSPLYQEKFKKAGLALSDVRKLEDISKIPFTEKDELREAQLSCPPVGKHRACTIEKLARIYSSSGTTGIPTYVGLTARDISNVHAEIIARFCWAGGIRPGSSLNRPENLPVFHSPRRNTAGEARSSR